MEQKPDLRDFLDCNAVLAMLQMAKEEERRKPRRPLAARARALAERYLDQLETDPERDLEQLAWVLKLLEAAREEEALAKKRPAPRPTGSRAPVFARKEMEPSPHLPDAVERAGAAGEATAGER